MSPRWLITLVTAVSLIATAINIKSTSVFWGGLMPVICILLMFATLLVWVADRVSGVQRPEVYVPTPEEIAAMKQRAERARAARAPNPGPAARRPG